MEEFVIIRPKSGSKKFQTMEGMKSFVNMSNDSGVNYQDQNMGTWDKERFPKSRQMFRPKWSKTKRKWMLKSFDENSTQLNELVTFCKLKYKVGHPLANQYIKETDIYDWADPFFNNKNFRVLAQEGDTVLDKTRPFDRLIFEGCLADPMFQYNTSLNAAFSNRVRYVIVDKTLEGNVRKDNREKDSKVHDLWKSLNDKKRTAIAVSLGLIKSEDTDSSLVEDILYEYAFSKAQAKGTHLSKQDIFMEMCDLSTEKLNVQYVIGKAKVAGFLTHNKQGWMLFGNNIGKSDKDIEKYFNDKQNQELVDRLEKQLENSSN